jgi:hypothetical protein
MPAPTHSSRAKTMLVTGGSAQSNDCRLTAASARLGVEERPPPPDLDCADILRHGFRVVALDRHRFDGDGVGCE